MSKLLGGRYKLGEMIGMGGMADVYTAHDQRLSREVAVKFLRSDLARDPSFVARFRKEALAAAGLNHPGIVAVYDSGEDPAPYIVMELVSGHTLRDIIQDGERLSVDRALEIGEGILAALEYSHSQGIAHRDIKPANVMITDQGVVKVMDFGIARALDDIGATLTSTWNIVGTAQYLSPEQALGEVTDSRSDIYSVGCLLYEVLVGRPPFIGDTPVSIAFQHVSGELIKPSNLNPELSQGLDVLLSVSLAKKPEDRYQSAAEMLSDIRKLRAGRPVSTKIAGKPIAKRIVVTALIVALVFGGMFAIANYANQATRSEVLISVPNVVGLSKTDAQDKLNGFVVTFERGHHPTIPVDLVASQVPLESTKVKSGTGIVLIISDGPGDAIVPSALVGLQLDVARTVLAAAGLVIRQTQAVPSDKKQGTVLRVTPESGTTVIAGSGVVLQIASGEVEVPLLVGLNEIQARTVLTQAGFTMQLIDAMDVTQEPGIVLAQAPEAGTTKTIGSAVTVTVNRTEVPTPIE